MQQIEHRRQQQRGAVKPRNLKLFGHPKADPGPGTKAVARGRRARDGDARGTGTAQCTKHHGKSAPHLVEPHGCAGMMWPASGTADQPVPLPADRLLGLEEPGHGGRPP